MKFMIDKKLFQEVCNCIYHLRIGFSNLQIKAIRVNKIGFKLC